MQRHRNSQKRYYIPGASYFITTNTHLRRPYFKEDIFCELFVEELNLCQRIHNFKLFGYKINPDHVHLLIKPEGISDYSRIIHFLKKNFTFNVNKITLPHRRRCPQRRRCATSPLGAKASPLAWFDEKINTYREKYIQNKNPLDHQIPFKWQKSFHYHIINDQNDFKNHIRYIKKQWIKHELKDNKWCYVSPLCGGI